MEKIFTYHPQNVCSREFEIGYDGDVITSLKVTGGCRGNLQGIGHLLQGMKIDEAINKLQGIICPGSRSGTTSCPDQIALALIELKKTL